MNTIITTLSGTVYDLEKLGITTREFNPSSPSPRHETEQINGLHGLVDCGTTYDARTIKCSFYLKAADVPDYYLMRDEVFKLFDSRQPFYITESYNPGKRWLVKTNAEYSINQQWIYGMFDVDLVAFSPFAESIGTTLDSFTFDSNLWQFSQGLIDETPTYVHRTTSFRIFNAGDVPINPRQFPLGITFRGASNNLTITNKTTGSVWKYNGTTSSGDTIRLDGVRSTKNSNSIFGATNRKLISINTGWNDFQIEGTSGSFEISFDFRFYYL
ncbi:phage tail family protein [Bacillus haynesii]|uniref:phage tail family protein n=1 Tax=Bacillus haynesii TaxID=1925021 RepID=UPI002281E0C9|nr:phage tail family protein [Bacillus haynesii]MCY8347589.1 phage tail family protein [Bacillus haynesii]